MNAWRPTTWYLYNMPTGGTYNIASSDMSAWRPTTWDLYNMPTGGTYNIASSDMSAWRPTTWDLYNMPTGGTYNIASSDWSAWTGVQTLYCYSMPSGAVSISAYTDFGSLASLHSVELQGDSLSQAQVNTVLQGLWTERASITYTTPALTINGNNAAPSGTYQSTCPPTTGYTWSYDLVHEICTGAGHAWTVATN